MTCLYPITAWKKRFSDLTQRSQDYYNDKKIKFKKPGKEIIKNYEEIKIPCNRCLGCRLDHSNQWATRITIEAKKHKKNCFVTLTYNPENLPLTEDYKMTLQKKDFQDFVKRLRYHIKEKISYFGCGEYGSTTYRPHYHIIIFGYEPEDLEEIQNSKTNNAMYTSKTLENIWGKGFITVQELNYKTACYTARYVQKKAGIKPTKRIVDKNFMETEYKIDERNGQPFQHIKTKYITEKTDIFGREKEFILMSKKPAIGKEYMEKNTKSIIENKGILLNIDGTVKNKQAPRYFQKLLEKKDFEKSIKFKYELQKNAKQQIENTLKNISVNQNDDKNKKYLQMVKINLEARAKYLKRNQI